jgi:phosphatidylinositol dimannoside acyltransferase
VRATAVGTDTPAGRPTGPRRPTGAGRPLSVPERMALRLLLLGSALLRLVPERLLHLIAGFTGRLLYAALPRRRALVRENLRRVLTWSAAREGTEPGTAATDDARLDARVRDVFRHWALTYLESAVALRWDAAELLRRVEIEDPDAAGRALAQVAPGERGRIYVSLHFGSVELSGLYASLVSGLPVLAPMETVRGRLAAAYFERVRGRFGVSLVPAAGAAGTLQRALEGGLSVGLVADRVVVGSGTLVDLFGAPARMPASPAVLAARSGAPVFVLAMQRTGRGRWRARVQELRRPDDAPRRDVARALLEQQVAAFEAFVSAAPEQWWTLLFPIWDDGRWRTAP